MAILFELISLPIAFGLLLGLLWLCFKLENILRHLGSILGRTLYDLMH